MSIFNCWPFKKKQKELDIVQSEPIKTPSKKALCVGINDYPGTSNDLQGCVNDAKDWSSLLNKTFGFQVVLLTNSKATAKNVKDSLENMIVNSNTGDVLAFTYSGHGTTVYDGSGDEEDKRDEAICCYDSIVIDDELRAIISKLPKGVKLNIISDSCHSGTITRAFLIKAANSKKPGRKAPKARYMPPPDGLQPRGIFTSTAKQFLSQDDMVEVLLTGCKPTEYSYDAYIGGKYSGAMTANAISIIKTNPKMTWNQLYANLRKKLPSGKYPQTPQLEGKKQNLDNALFS